METIVTKKIDATDHRIIDEMAKGNTIKETAENLHLSQRCVDTRLTAMREELKCSNSVELIVRIKTEELETQIKDLKKERDYYRKIAKEVDKTLA